MRRLISYLLLSLTTILVIGANFLSVIGTLNANLEFTTGREMVFRIADKENDDVVFEDNTEVSAIANTMITRLENALVTKYDVIVEGNTQIRVTVSENSEIKYTRLQKYLAFDAEFTLCTTTEVCATPEQMFDDSTARVEYRGQNPIVVFPVSDATYIKEVLLTEAGGPENTSAELILWAGKVEEDNYQDSLNNPDMAQKIVLRFPVASLWWDEETTTELATVISPSKYGSANANNVFEPTAVSQANEEAIYYRNLFNASDLPVNVEFLFSKTIQPSIEPILSLQNVLTIANSQTIWAMVIATLLTLIVLVIFYRLAAVGMIATSALSVFLTLFAFVSLRLEFSSAALLAILTVGSLGLLTSILYLTYLRREIYVGRTFKKAHVEANGKLIPVMIDITVVGLIFGLFTYLFGGNLVRSFSVFIMIGSVINLVVVYLGNQWLYSQLLQAPILKEKLSWLNVDGKLIPNTLTGEKPVYFGRFATRDFASKGSLLTPIAYIAGVLSLIAIFSFSLLDLPVVQPPLNTTAARLYVEVKEFSQFETTADVQGLIIDHILVDGEPLTVVGEIEVQELSRREDDINVDYRIYVADLSPSVVSAESFVFDNGDVNFEETDLNVLLEEIIFGVYGDDQVALIGYYPADPITNQPTVVEITFGALFGLLFVAIYFVFRGGFAKALTIILVSGATALMTLGLFIATRIPSPSILALSLLTLTYLSILFSVVIFTKAKEERSLIKDRAITLDDYTLSLKKASSQSAAAIFLTLLSFVYPGLTFLALGPGALQGLFAALLLGSGLIALFVTGIIPATFKPIYGLFKGLNQVWTLPNPFAKKGAASKTETNARSTEPQEATYIGIND